MAYDHVYRLTFLGVHDWDKRSRTIILRDWLDVEPDAALVKRDVCRRDNLFEI